MNARIMNVKLHFLPPSARAHTFFELLTTVQHRPGGRGALDEGSFVGLTKLRGGKEEEGNPSL
jgi:hypothetical protein